MNLNFESILKGENTHSRWGVYIYTTGSAKGAGVDEMTMNDHEGEGQVLEMTTWSLELKCI